jgi:hypothetical protein
MLTEALIRAAKRRDKPYKLFDERGLYLLIDPKYSPGWRFKYYFEGREKLLSLGTYPDVTLRRAHRAGALKSNCCERRIRSPHFLSRATSCDMKAAWASWVIC